LFGLNTSIRVPGRKKTGMTAGVYLEAYKRLEGIGCLRGVGRISRISRIGRMWEGRGLVPGIDSVSVDKVDQG
jgi:hypothetical protein